MGTKGAVPAGDGNGDRERHGPVTTRTAGGSEGIDGWPAEDGARARSILRYAAEVVEIRAGDGSLRYVSPTVTAVLGYEPGALLGRPAIALVHEDDREAFERALTDVRSRRGGHTDLQYRVRHLDGSWRWFESRIANLLEDPAVGGIVLCSWDETERRRAIDEGARSREALHSGEARFRSLVQHASDFVIVWDRDGRISYLSPSTERFLGTRLEVGEPALQRDLLHPDDVEVVAGVFEEILAGRAVARSVECRVLGLEGRYHWMEATATSLLDDPAVAGVVLNARDVTEHREAEQALRESEERFRALVEYSSDIVSVLDADGTWRTSSSGGTRLLGWPKGIDPEGGIFSLVHPDDRERAAVAFQELFDGRRGPDEPVVVRVATTDGGYRHLETVGQDLSGHPAIRGVVLNSRDVTERVDAEEALRRSEARFRALVQNSSDMVTVLDQDGVFTYASESVERVLGYRSQELVGRSAFEIVHPEDREIAVGSLARAFDEPEWFELVEVRVAHADGSWRDVELLGTNLLDDPAVRGLVVNARDVTERKEAEQAVRESEERFRSLAQHASDMITVLGPDGKVLYASPSAGRLMGYGDDWGLGEEHWDLIHPDDIDEVARVFAEAMSQPGVGPGLILRVRHGDGSWRWIEARSNNLLDEPAVGGVVITARDLTEQVEAAEALRESEALVAEQARILQMIAQGSPLPDVLAEACLVVERHAPGVLCSVLLLDDDGATLRHGAAPSLPDAFVGVVAAGVPVAPTAGSCGAAAYRREPVASADLATDPLWAEWRELALSHGLRAAWSTPIMSSGHERVLGTVAIYYTEPRSPLPEHEQIVDLVVHLASIAIERKDSEERLAHQAHHDSLTGLPNRTLFLEFLEVALARARRADSRLAVLFLDLDRFKVVNDSLGHDAGDELLMALGSRLREVVRPGDTVARFGGDEFVVLCQDISAEAAHHQALEVADRLLQAVTQPFVLDGDEHFLSASIGVAIGPRDGEQPDELLRDADAAMYRAKERGKGRSELFDEAMRASARDRLETEDALHRALDRGEFRLVYQPIVALADGRCVGAEALLRWEHPERGLLAPCAFVERAEESGLIVPIGAWVIEEAALQASRWVAARRGDPFVVSVNLSARQLAHRETPDRVAAALESSGIDPAGLCLEITESVLMGEGSMAAVEALHALGVSLSIDDFGTGYSSLGYLKRFPVDAVKVDRAFVDGLGTDPEDSAIVTAVVSLGHALGLTVVAEGVETRAQLDELVTLGCDQAQGYLFARPQRAARLDDLVVGGLRATA